MAVLTGPEKETVSAPTGLRDVSVAPDRSAKFRGTVFTCPRCGVVAAQSWIDTYRKYRDFKTGRMVEVEEKLEDLALSTCSSCTGRSLWFEGKLFYPKLNSAEPMPIDLPSSVQIDYEEAQAIASTSPRGAAALLRMCVENLCKSVTGKGSFDAAIGELERSGLPPAISTAMDVVRSNGNEALHAGRLYGNDDAGTVTLLFRLVRSIVSWSITEKRELDDLYQQIPPEKREHIEKRRAGAKSKGAAKSG